jgi:hypothetical protein
MSQITIGLAEIGIGEIATDGGMGTTLAPWGYTEQDSCVFTIEDPDITDFIPEEIDDAIHSQEIPGAKTLAFTLMDPDVDTLEAVTGGEVVTTGTAPNEVDTFHAPASSVNIERSIKVTTKQGLCLEITRAKITYSMDSAFSKNGLFTIKVMAKVLKPTKAGESSWRMYKG